LGSWSIATVWYSNHYHGLLGIPPDGWGFPMISPWKKIPSKPLHWSIGDGNPAMAMMTPEGI